MTVLTSSMINGRGLVVWTLCAGILAFSGCESSLDKNRSELDELRKSIGMIDNLESESVIRPLKSDPDSLTRNDGARIEDERLEKLVKILSTESYQDLSLADCRSLTLKNNLDLQADFINPQIARQQVLAQQAKFESTFNLSVNETRTVSPNFYGSGSTSTYISDSLIVTPSLAIPLHSGGVVTLDWSLYTNAYDSGDSQTSSSSAQNQVSVSLQQPLLRNAWMDYNEASIVLAQVGEGAAAATTQLAVINSLVQTESLYWTLFLAWERLNVQIEIYKRTKSVLDDARSMVDKKQGSISSVYNFEVTLASSVSNVIDAELDLRLAGRALKTQMQDPSISLDSSYSLRPTSKPVLIAFDFDRDKLVKLAMENRADLLQMELDQVSDAVNVMMAENQMLPDLNIIAGYNLNGISAQNASLRTATKDLYDENSPSGWQIGLTASVPLGNEAAIAAYQGALLMRLQSIADIRSQEILVTREVLDSVDRLKAGWELILTSRYQVAAAQRNVDAMSTLFQLGERASTDLANSIFLLAEAQIQSAKSEADYQINLAILAKSAGCLMGHAGIEWGQFADPSLLEKSETMPKPITEDLADSERERLSNPLVVPGDDAPDQTEHGTPP
ncbi:MAG: TolC family protein [Phycisphaerales bacterium]|nr:TolC family protein [Phycisphaerales bacterium]